MFWEKEIYSKNKQLNKYPYDSIVSFVFRKFGHLSLEERYKIKILEVGCGACNNICFLSEEGFDTYGIDISKSAIEFGINRLKQKKLKADLKIGSFSELPYKNDYFDLIIDRLSITQSPQLINESLSSINRVLKENGLFYTEFFNTNHDGYTKSIGIEETINDYGFMKVHDKYLSTEAGPTYFIDDNNTIIKKYFKILDITKVTRNYNDIIDSTTIFILTK
jgi:ubiquinone/menaquinone biosynthesis C-methylase UbiE